MKIKETFKGMKILGIAMLMLISVYSTLISGNNRQPSIIQGEWKGLLKVQGMELNLIFDIKSVDDSLKAAFYSIDQTPNPIPVSSIKFENGTLEVEMPIIKASFQGKLTDNVIVGTFTQGMNFPLELRKMKEKELSLELRKVKERESKDKDNSLLYNSIEVKFENKEAGITLAGTLTIPKEGTNFAAVALVTGSGAQNRDETIMQHKPFKRIANYLSSKGFAVLRYDDRGVAESKGDFAASTTLDFLSDALAAVKFLKSYPDIDSSQIGIIGHSEGGAISVMAAVQNKDVKFIISLAGPMMPGKNILLLQTDKINEANGDNELTVKMKHNLNLGAYNILEKEQNNEKAKQDILKLIESADTNVFNAEVKKAIGLSLNSAVSDWFRYFLQLNPADYILQLQCPALLMFAEKDIQVPAKENKEAYYDKIKGKELKHITVKTIESVNHLFQKAGKGTLDEYNNYDNPAMNDETLESIYNWLKELRVKNQELKILKNKLNIFSYENKRRSL